LPVQIGDLASLKSLNLRRNHLQEVPVGKTLLKWLRVRRSNFMRSKFNFFMRSNF
jgi:hypothetical protein